MSRRTLRRILAGVVVAAACVIVNTGAAAQRTELERLIARAMDTSGAKPEDAGPIDIVIGGWSTEKAQDILRTAVTEGPDQLLPALEKVKRPEGVVLSPGVQVGGARALERRRMGILFAREIKVPTGRQVIVITDEPAGFVQPARNKTRPTANAFTLIDVRIGADGNGVGKIGSADQVVYNKATNTLELKDFAGHPAELVEVKSMKR
jgi:hypothetical protein